MQGHPNFWPGSGGGFRGQPPQQQHPPPSQPLQLATNFNPNLAFQDPNFHLQNLLVNALLQNFPLQQNIDANFLVPQNPNFQLQNPNFPPQNHNFSAGNPNFGSPPPPLSPQTQVPVSSAQQNPSNFLKQRKQKRKELSEGTDRAVDTPTKFLGSSAQPKPLKVSKESKKNRKELLEGTDSVVITPTLVPSSSVQQKSPNLWKQSKQNRKELLERIDGAVDKARRDMIAAKECVTAWKVSEAALVTLQVDSWGSLGFKMQEVPSLHRLIVTEGKINAFIHCFVAVRRITSLYDLEVAICENEGIERFEELELGPVLQHPLVLHYFSMNSDATEVFKITSEEIVQHLYEFLDFSKKKKVIVDKFLAFIAEKRSVVQKELLGIRIQSLGLHISFLQEAKGSEKEMLKRCQKLLRRKSDKKGQKRPQLASMKKDLDERFRSISQRVESFSSARKDFCGKHTRFELSSSEDEESDDSSYEDDMTNNNGSQARFSSPSICSSERVRGCPYPSVSEEISRLGLKGMSYQSSPASGSSRQNKNDKLLKKKRKLEVVNCTASAPSKLLRVDAGKHSLFPIEDDNKTREIVDEADTLTRETIDDDDISLSNNTMKVFITNWKEACREQPIAEVFQRMVQFYKPRGYKASVRFKKMMKSAFSSNPGIGLLNIAVASIKCGMWDSIYDTFQDISQHEVTNNHSTEYSEFEKIDVDPGVKIDVEPCEQRIAVVSEHSAQESCSVAVEEIIRKITRYYELDQEVQSNGKSLQERKFLSLRKLCNCEFWMVDQFGVKEFRSLGYGEFLNFLEKHAPLLPIELQDLLSSKISENSALEVCVVQHQLVALVSQASNNIWVNETLTKQMISSLLIRQFPFLGFKIMENNSLEDFLEIVRKHRNDVISNCILFSASLCGGSLPWKEDHMLETTAMRTNNSQKTMLFESVTSRDAIEVLVRAPMLSDLYLWSHWDQIFAPSLGPLVLWLLSEANTKELLCLVTKHGDVIRIDPSATADSFMEAALERSSFQTAVKLLSLFSLAGGENHVPLSLLKCYARQAFDVLVSDHYGNVEGNMNDLLDGKVVICKVENEPTRMNNMVPVASRFVLDCLGYLPSEFHGFAADVLLSGMKSVIKDAPAAILSVCNQKERFMLHEIGLSLGIIEWIDDYHAFYSTGTTELFISSGSSCSTVPKSDLSMVSTYMPNTLNQCVPKYGEVVVSHQGDEHGEECTEVSQAIGSATISDEGITKDGLEQLSDDNKHKEAALLVESIRRDEFGLDPNLSNMESSMLKKQHARLGRALHCLSQELYSQDSHFLLELVQNADDNIYLENVEPTLTFILQESGIIILNNEQGFSAQNIRALCDVGNSTKKGSDSGYIGQKGIGFKSVFRVTDAPEIHSNGFHIKFDISEGQIGFVLPTTVPPCNIDLFSKLLSRDAGQIDKKCWNTCIVLPFRSKFSGETAMKMFTDLHPSLLLFLHRLRCIVFRNMLNDSLVVMKKETMEDGIVKVSCGKDKMTWLVASQKLKAHASRPKVQTTEIAIAFTLEELDNGVYSPQLNQQPVFAFLPLRTYGLKFILQGDFVLPSSREEVDKNNPWNEWLLMKFPALFVGAEKYFCALSCFRECPGKAVAAFMSFIPLVGEVHGFFSGLPKAIILELRRTGCMLLEGDNSKMVPPCNVLRGWNEQARNLLPEGLLRQHLGLGFLDKDIVLSDSLARALGIAEYGPELLVRFMNCLCRTDHGLKLMGLGWLSSWLNVLYTMISHSSDLNDLVESLRYIPFIPLSDGTYSSVDAGTIWLHSDGASAGSNSAQGLEAFPNLCSKIRIVDPLLLSASAVEGTSVDNITGMFHRMGIQQLSAHEIIKVNILPDVSNDRISIGDKNLMLDYLCFVMIHLQSSCHSCYTERMYIISELRSKAYISTNHGYKRSTETPIHFGREFGNPINVDKLVDGVDLKWHEVDINYLKHPANESLSNKVIKWREFFQEIGVTDFVQVVQIDKSFMDLSHTNFRNITWNMDLISSGSMVKDWVSDELVHLLCVSSTVGDRERCKYLLEVLDMLWDNSFSDKVTGYCSSKRSDDDRSFTSSFLCNVCDVQWVASSLDDKLYYPTELFYDCDTVRSLLGASAPYAVPKVKSEKLLRDIGFKTRVMLNDVLEILEVWRKSGTPFKASIAQMTKFYTFIWDEMVTSKSKILEAIHSGPFIFVPCATSSRHEDLVPGIFLSSKEVYWHDPTGSVDLMKGIHPQYSSTAATEHPISKSLCSMYPGLHQFFVKECGVRDFPSWHDYLDILQKLSTVTCPTQASSVVFQVFSKWTDELKSGLLSSEDIIQLKEYLTKLEYTVLPTVQDKWVSLHPSNGLVCWCDDKQLAKRFKNMENIDFLYFGNLNDREEEMVQTKMCVLMQNLGIPALSDVITREAIFYGPADCSSKVSLINWALPYAQRYVYSVHREKYLQFKQSEFRSLKQLEIVVVKKLFYRNVVKGSGASSVKRYECSSLLQGNTLYATVESDSHALFLELSRLFFDGTPDLHVANFLHMIKTMAESGTSEEQAEFFIVNSQNVLKLPDEESVWSLSSITHLTQDDESPETGVASAGMKEQKSFRPNKRAGTNSNWPPADWKTAPDFNYARTNGYKTQAAVSPPSSSDKLEDNSMDIVTESLSMLPIETDTDWTIEDINDAAIVLPDFESENVENPVFACNQTPNVAFDPVDLRIVSDKPELSSSRFCRRDQLNTRTINGSQAMVIGRLGEQVAYKYLTDKCGKKAVKWVNEDIETGLPYDIVIGEEEGDREYIEVKATKSMKKDWFIISMREWQYALEKGESFSIVHVVLLGNNAARVTTFRNPARQCQQGKLQLVVMMPRQQGASVVS